MNDVHPNSLITDSFRFDRRMVKVLEASGGHEDEEEDEYGAPEPECGSKLLIGSMIYQRYGTRTLSLSLSHLIKE